MTSFCCFYCYFWTYFTSFSTVSIIDFEQVNVNWADKKMFKMIPKKIKKVDNLCSKFTINPPKRHTCNVNKHDKNFLLSPITIAEATSGSSALIWSSMGTGAIFSPPAVIIISRGKKGRYILLSVSKSNWPAEISFNWIYPANNYLFKVNNRNTGKKCEIKTSLTSLWCFYC